MVDTDLRDHIRLTFSRALDQGYIQVYYQPVIRAISRKLCSFEVLARWCDPDLGMIGPDVFIPVLEEMGLVHLLDVHVLKRACARIRQMADDSLPPVPMSVNLSRLDFSLCDIYASIRDVVTLYQIPHDFIYLEITESVLAERGSAMSETVERLREEGFQIWMDDFGSGYSSLNVLKDFAFDEIKLDMQFLSSFDQRSRRIMTSVIQMAKEIDIHTLAEGVETEEQFRYLRNIGCEKVQGFYFGRPAPFDEAMAHLASIGIEVEMPAERPYYDGIGKVDFLSSVPFMTREEKDSLTTARELNSIPLAIAEAREDSFSILFYNKAFEEIARGTGLIANIFTQEMLRRPQPLSMLPSRVVTLMDSTRTGEEGRMVFISNEEYYEIQAKCIAQMSDAYSVLFRMSNLSRAAKIASTGRLDDELRQLYALYERISIIDVEADTVMPLYVATRDDLVSGRTGLAALSKEYADRWIFPDDREAYLALWNLGTLEERIGASGHTYVSKTLRTSVRHGRYAWKHYTIMRLSKETYVELIRNIDEDVKAIIARCGDWHMSTSGTSSAPSLDADIWHALVSSGLIRLFWKDAQRRFLGASQGFFDYYGFESKADIVGKTDEEVGWHVSPEHYMTDEMRVLSEGITTHNVPGHCIARGENRDILASKTPLYDVNGDIIGLVGYFIDKDLLTVNDARGVETKRRDILTGLLNSRGIHEEARFYRDEYHLRGTDFCRMHVALNDIDAINQNYGFDFGDKAIVALGHALKQAFGKTSAVGRVSGHQLAILTQIHSPGDERAMVWKAKQAAEEIREIDGIALTLYVSVGSCRFSEVETLEQQTKKAEVRLLADNGEHASLAVRQERASQIFHLYDDLPISYAVYHVIVDEYGQVTDARLFYVNHSYESRAGMSSRDLLGKSTRELFPTLEENWYDIARRAALEGEIIIDHLSFEPTGQSYAMTASQVIREGYCCFTYMELDG